jgi:hypothetical protein
VGGARNREQLGRPLNQAERDRAADPQARRVRSFAQDSASATPEGLRRRRTISQPIPTMIAAITK